MDRGVAAQADKGIRINANGGSYEITATDNPYYGAITAIASTTAGYVTVYEK